MSTIVDLLRKNSELEKAAYSEYVKSSTASSINLLVNKGMAFEKAASLVKEACSESEELQEKVNSFLLLEKLATHIEGLESELSGLKKQAQDEVDAGVIKEPMDKLANMGFTEEDLKSLREVDPVLLEKMASISSAPWEMGKAAGVAREKTDPLLEFILG